MKEFRRRKKTLIHRNFENYGIPQGTPVSAVYANIYMADFDKALTDYVTERNGIYWRYCDDIILVLPIKKEKLRDQSESIQGFVEECEKKIPNLVINKEKTAQFFYSDHHFSEMNMGIMEAHDMGDEENVGISKEFPRKTVKMLMLSVHIRSFRKVIALKAGSKCNSADTGGRLREGYSLKGGVIFLWNTKDSLEEEVSKDDLCHGRLPSGFSKV